MATHEVEFWTPNKDIAKRLATRMFGGIKVKKKNWRMRYNKEPTQLFEDSDTL